jgi:hypothetical protein
MPKLSLMDEIHITIWAPRTLSKQSCRAIRRTLQAPHFNADLRRTVRTLVRQYPSLASVHVKIGR